jgi:hypothetical protein
MKNVCLIWNFKMFDLLSQYFFIIWTYQIEYKRASERKWMFLRLVTSIGESGIYIHNGIQ